MEEEDSSQQNWRSCRQEGERLRTGQKHGDRIRTGRQVCAFTSLFAMLETENPERTSCCILVDKEEIGSVGATGMHSRFFEDYVAELMALTEDGNPLKVRRALRNSYMLSSDVSAAFDPLYADAFEKKNTAYFGRGLVFNKFTGSRGKNNSNDANAEYIAKVRQVLDNMKSDSRLRRWVESILEAAEPSHILWQIMV